MSEVAVWGIDLGTTYSAISRLDSYGRPVVIQNREGSYTTPSVVLFEPGTGRIVVGQEAKFEAVKEPERVVEFVKRYMGQPGWTKEVDGQEYRPEQISSLILRKLAEDAEEQENEPVKNVVITVPAYFNDVERAATESAGKLAGLNVLGVLDEPTAAAVFYARQAEEKGNTLGGNVLVYDLGGGTFDITVINMDENISVVVTDGNHSLGGKDWDDVLIMHVAGEFQKEFKIDPMEDLQSLQELRVNCETAKRGLSNRDSVNVPVSCQGQVGSVTVTRETFDELTAGLLASTIELTKKCIAEAEAKGATIGEVLLVGGSSRMKQVAPAVSEVTGKEPRLFEPDMAVAKGAAIKAAWDAVGGDVEVVTVEGDTVVAEPGTVVVPGLIDGTGIREVRGVLSHSLGTILWGDDPRYDAWDHEYVEIMLEKQTPLPCEFRKTFYTRGQTDEVRIRVTQGEDENPAECTLLVEKMFQLPRVLPAESPIELEYRANKNAMLEITVIDLTDGTRMDFDVERVGIMNAEEVEAAREAISALELRK